MPLPNASTIDTYGGQKADAWPVEDPATTASAANWNDAISDVAGMTHTAVRARIRWTGATYTSGTMTMTIESRDAVWGNAETVTVTQTAAGVYVLTYPSTITDALGVTRAVSFVDVASVKVASSPPRAWYADVTSPNVVTIHTTDLAGSANACNGQSITAFLV